MQLKSINTNIEISKISVLFILRARYSKLYSCGLANHLLPVVISENLQDFAAIDAAYFIKVPNFRPFNIDQDCLLDAPALLR